MMNLNLKNGEIYFVKNLQKDKKKELDSCFKDKTKKQKSNLSNIKIMILYFIELSRLKPDFSYLITKIKEKKTVTVANSQLITDFHKKPTTQLVIQRLEYWFRGKKKKGFFKFTEPCDHKLYREGDSWTEEIGISRRTFNRHFDSIGARWGSKSSFNKAKDPFLGKLYACYYDRKENMTRYFRNPNLSTKTQTKNLSSTLLNSEKEAVKNKIYKKLEERRDFYKKGDNMSSIKRSNDRFRTVKTADLLYTRLTTKKYKYFSKEAEKKLEEIQNIWKKEIGGRTYTSSAFLKKLYEAFEKLFKGSLDLWKKYCRKIASSKFLMGEISGFRAWLSWAIKEETVERLEAGEFTLGDRESKESLAEKTQETAIEARKHIESLSGKEKKVHEFLRKRVGDSPYLSWFKKTALIDSSENRTILVMGSDFKVSYVKATFWRELEELKKSFFSTRDFSVEKREAHQQGS